jgi:tRNA threonylcarbamoyladenosine modification (KEOPS) complex  Pcc1 subunit
MNYSSIIEVKLKNPKELLQIFEPELKILLNDRASYKLQQEENSLKFIITAKDSVSLRATFNSITKLFTIYEKLS